MALQLENYTPGKKSQTESLDMMSGSDDSVLIRAGETLDGDTQDLRIVALVVNEDAVIGNLIADDRTADQAGDPGTDVVAGGLVKGFKNIDGQTLTAGTFIPAGKYYKSRTWRSVTVTSGSVVAYYNYVQNNTPIV